jgi:hypothetical protein
MPDIIKIKEEYKNREIHRLRENKLRNRQTLEAGVDFKVSVDQKLKHQSMKAVSNNLIGWLDTAEGNVEDKKKAKLQRVQTELDANVDLNTLKKISAVKKRTSLISQTCALEIQKHKEEELIASTKALIRDAVLGRKVPKSHQSVELDKIDLKIEALYNKRHEFRFKSLRPWVVLSAGDCINS